MHATHLIFTAISGRPPARIGKEICGICGSQGAAPYEFSSKFTNWDLVRTEALCEACTFCLREPSLRRQSFVCTRTGYRPLVYRWELARALFSPPVPPFVFCVTRSHKKHNAIRARVNYSSDSFHVRMEDLEPLIIPRFHERVHDAMRQLYAAGITKQELATGQVGHRKLSAVGIGAWLNLDQLVKEVRGTPEMELLLHILTKEEKDEGVRSPDNAP
jgi:hypothetical protein